MRQTTAAITAGLLLVAGQATAADGSAVSRAGDRVGAQVRADSSEFASVPLPVMLIGAAVLIAAISVATDDDSESD